MSDTTNEYYDEVDEEAYARSRENRSLPRPEDRSQWVSATVDTTGQGGPRTEDVTPAFAQFRADSLANPVTADADDDQVAREQADAAQAAQDEADRIRESAGFVAPTGPDAGQYDDPKLEDSVPAENFSAAPAEDEANVEEHNGTADAGNTEYNGTADAGNVDHVDAPVQVDVPEDTNHDGVVDENEARAANE